MNSHDDSKKRRPPAFQEYPADMQAGEAVREMDLPEVGLLTLMRWSYWINGSLPRDPRRIGRVLGVDPRKIRARLTPGVLSHFAADPADDQRLTCPELDRQLARLNELRRKQSEGGADGRRKQLERGKPGETPQGDPANPDRGKPGVPEQNRTLLTGKSFPSVEELPARRFETSPEDVEEMERLFAERPSRAMKK